ncbi:hypothetical protein qdsa001_105 [Staphylococcus phage qdsa001]|nr:hypothetical protein qdsa001_105 [Staphylococcus phage qdsa001]UVD42516.1 hypothetical protein [Staphylococcus phage vB_SauM-V1SA19]
MFSYKRYSITLCLFTCSLFQDECRLFVHLTYIRARFFFHQSLVVLLSRQEIVVEGLPYSFELRTFPAILPLFFVLGFNLNVSN